MESSSGQRAKMAIVGCADGNLTSVR